jgi:cellulose biosynthesis protein BcsQ
MSSSPAKKPKLAPDAEIVTLHANKGGTGKTTTALRVSIELARKGHTVLMYDCDGQCSLTLLCLERLRAAGCDVNSAYEAESAPLVKGGSATLRECPPPPGLASSGWEEGPVASLYDQYVQEWCSYNYTPPPPARACEVPFGDGAGRLLLVGGHSEIEELSGHLAANESLLATDIVRKSQTQVVRECLMVTARAYSADFVIVDTGPAATVLNRTLFMAADSYVVAYMCDDMSLSMARRFKVRLARFASVMAGVCTLAAEKGNKVHRGATELPRLLGAALNVVGTVEARHDAVFDQLQSVLSTMGADVSNGSVIGPRDQDFMKWAQSMWKK